MGAFCMDASTVGGRRVVGMRELLAKSVVIVKYLVPGDWACFQKLLIEGGLWMCAQGPIPTMACIQIL